MAYDVSGAERYLVDAARDQPLVTYGELAEKFGGSGNWRRTFEAARVPVKRQVFLQRSSLAAGWRASRTFSWPMPRKVLPRRRRREKSEAET